MDKLEASKVLAQAIAILVDAKKGDPQSLLDRLDAAGSRMDKAIAKVDTIEELVEAVGEGILDLIIDEGTKFIKKQGPLGLIDAVVGGVADVKDFLEGDD